MAIVSAAAQQSILLAGCTSGGITLPSIAGINVDLIEANVVQDVALTLPAGMYLGHGDKDFTGLSFCNVSVTYHHSGYPKEPIRVHVFLPEEAKWNNRMMAVGGGGFKAGLASMMGDSMVAATHDGYVTVGTDAGHDYIDEDPKYWALKEPGKVNEHLLETFAYTAYGDMAPIGVEVTKAYYGKEPSKKYWNGCSTGGRQGLASAQRYPEAYDGILANAPAVNWARLLPSLVYAQLIMDENQVYPSQCEFDAIREEAIKDCDLHDGVADGILSAPTSCLFDSHSLVGKAINCSDTTKIGKIAAKVADGIWYGPKTTTGDKLFYGIAHDGLLAGMFSQANIVCEAGKCRGEHFSPGLQWVRDFLAKDSNYDLTKMTREEFEKFFQMSIDEYTSTMSTDNPDLSAFNKRGGKMITVHGIADQIIPVYSMREYYDRVLARDPQAASFYKYYEAPGMWHCFGGPGFYPRDAFDDLVRWVEQGKAPDTLMGTAMDEENNPYKRPLCQYPRVARYDGTGDTKDPNNFHCADDHLSSTPIGTIVRKTMEYITGSSTKAAQRDEL